jgi:hypothetical protein
MDILEIIREKAQTLPQGDYILGLEAVILHIETAERYLSRAIEENDENLFTDVIYRTNHAFEGILKEAYAILAGKDALRRTPHDIEQYLLENDIFKSRVMDLFTNYRTKWRNPSTHDYKLFFSEQEAFLAIVSVSAFVSILLDQIVEQISYETERAETEQHVDAIRESMPGYETLPVIDRVRELLVAFANEKVQKVPSSEYEVLGLLTGFISSVDPTIEMRQEERIDLGNTVLRADLILSSEEEQVIVELKVAPATTANISRAEQQLVTFLYGTGITKGVIYFLPRQVSDHMTVEDATVRLGDETYRVLRIFPERGAAY